MTRSPNSGVVIAFRVHRVYDPGRLPNTKTQSLVDVQVKAGDEKLKVSLHGFVSNANHNAKRIVMVLFINGRLVDSAPVSLPPTYKHVYIPYVCTYICQMHDDGLLDQLKI